MQKVYLLLRNNQQTGPYSFEELLQLHLKPFDLIWVEGKSYGWRYPTEVESLKPYVATPATPQPKAATTIPEEPAFTQVTPPQQKNVFVSMPANGSLRTQPEIKAVDPIEQKAEELRKRVQSFTPVQEPVKTNYARDLQDGEQEYTQWVYQKKTKKKTLLQRKPVTIAVICLLLLAGGWFIAGSFNSPSVVAGNTTPPLNIEKTEPVAVDEKETIEDNFIPPVTTSSSASKTGTTKEKIKDQNHTSTAINPQQETPQIPSIIQNEPIEKPSDNTTVEEKEKEVITEAPAENKKTLKEKINDLFQKRKTNESSKENEPGSADNGTNGRKATHRNDENESSPVMVDVSNEVEVKTNKIADSWMMGVKGLKLTLYNRSDVIVNEAKVEVLYYSDQNNLLQTKVLSYSNIPPKKSQTVGAPDMRLADHIEYKVLSATGIQNAYANK